MALLRDLGAYRKRFAATGKRMEIKAYERREIEKAAKAAARQATQATKH